MGWAVYWGHVEDLGCYPVEWLERMSIFFTTGLNRAFNKLKYVVNFQEGNMARENFQDWT